MAEGAWFPPSAGRPLDLPARPPPRVLLLQASLLARAGRSADAGQLVQPPLRPVRTSGGSPNAPFVVAPPWTTRSSQSVRGGPTSSASLRPPQRAPRRVWLSCPDHLPGRLASRPPRDVDWFRVTAPRPSAAETEANATGLKSLKRAFERAQPSALRASQRPPLPRLAPPSFSPFGASSLLQQNPSALTNAHEASSVRQPNAQFPHFPHFGLREAGRNSMGSNPIILQTGLHFFADRLQTGLHFLQTACRPVCTFCRPLADRSALSPQCCLSSSGRRAVGAPRPRPGRAGRHFADRRNMSSKG